MNELLETINGTEPTRLFFYGVFVIILLWTVFEGITEIIKAKKK